MTLGDYKQNQHHLKKQDLDIVNLTGTAALTTRPPLITSKILSSSSPLDQSDKRRTANTPRLYPNLDNHLFCERYATAPSDKPIMKKKVLSAQT